MHPTFKPDKEQPGKDFLLTHSRVTRVQFVGLLFLGLNLIAIGTLIWVIYLSGLVGSSSVSDICTLVGGSAVCGFLAYLGYLHIRRSFVGRGQKARSQNAENRPDGKQT